MKNKVLLMIADGLGDRPCEELGWKTPLEAARKENLDRIASWGSSGIMDLWQCGTPVGTDLGHMILFGYGLPDYPGRGPIEAFGEGLELQPGDIALRANFATCRDGLVADRRAGRIRQGTRELAAALDGMQVEDVQVLFKEATEHRAVMVLRGPGLSSAVTDADPKKEGLPIRPVRPRDGSPEAERTARILDRVLVRCQEILSQHPLNRKREAAGLLPANAILTRGAGQMPKLEKTVEKYHLKAACVAAESTVLGAARLAGFDIYTDPERMTGNLDTDIDRKVELAVKALADHDFVVLHMKAPDLMGHDGDPRGKVRAIERYDAMAGKVLEEIPKLTGFNLILALAADHSTPCERREHSGDPVPIVVAGKNIRKDQVTEYDEIHGAQGGLNRMTGHMFFQFLMDYLEVVPKEGN
ncbi:2,3-bisphosphoglycerate-independent phosphoglycerate mutase [Acidaminococcus massiliensis]|uniref:2,3-bisphosphoglycerate-independent phosphoglycerate mutase n=1 Tax=Acidaminococcus massiliensis TaxID=1852375 RepID=UPI0022E50332|nr:2,3-bisphosphoglycerate-independent phosphoglycerate mutase [Acidaminococcus massiliensis]